jgi:hypothetical protein
MPHPLRTSTSSATPPPLPLLLPVLVTGGIVAASAFLPAPAAANSTGCRALSSSYTPN